MSLSCASGVGVHISLPPVTPRRVEATPGQVVLPLLNFSDSWNNHSFFFLFLSYRTPFFLDLIFFSRTDFCRTNFFPEPNFRFQPFPGQIFLLQTFPRHNFLSLSGQIFFSRLSFSFPVLIFLSLSRQKFRFPKISFFPSQYLCPRQLSMQRLFVLSAFGILWHIVWTNPIKS